MVGAEPVSYCRPASKAMSPGLGWCAGVALLAGVARMEGEVRAQGFGPRGRWG